MKNRSFRFLVSFWLVTVAVNSALAQKNPPQPPADASSPLLVWDVAPDLRDGLPRNFRTTSDQLKAKSGAVPSVDGLVDLHASGSAEFTASGLKLMLAKASGPVTVFDLRQEDHLFVNGEPISWMATNNWANVGKSNEKIIAGEVARAAALKPGTQLDLADDRVKKGTSGAAPSERVTVTKVQTEADVVAAAGAAYVRVTVTDHARPLDEEVDRFILAVRAMPANGWAHFHCRAGKGRTTTFLALYDILRNAPRVGLEDIVNRQSLLVGDYNLLSKEKEPGAGWKADIAADRADFVRAFYQYSRTNPDGRPQLWSEWLKSAPDKP